METDEPDVGWRPGTNTRLRLLSFLRHDADLFSDDAASFSGSESSSSPPASSSNESAADYSSAGCTPAVKHQTGGLGNEVRNLKRRYADTVFDVGS